MDPKTLLGSPDPVRRNLLRSAAIGVAAVPVLAACGSDETTPGTASQPSGEPSNDSGASDAPSPDSGDEGAAGGALASTADVAVGGALFLEGVVITQPSTGEFFAFDRECTHQSCPVTDLQDGLIHCNCHGSLFDPSTGEPMGGPASAPLATIAITVEGDQILPG